MSDVEFPADPSPRWAEPIEVALENPNEVDLDLDEREIDWSRGVYLPPPLRRDILHGLRGDLYLNEGEAAVIVRDRRAEAPSVTENVVARLRQEPPLFHRVAYLQSLLEKRTCSWFASWFSDCVTASEKTQWRRELQEKLSGPLRMAAQDSDPLVAQEARNLLNRLDDPRRLEASR